MAKRSTHISMSEKDYSIGGSDRWWGTYMQVSDPHVSHEMVSDGVNFYISQMIRQYHHKYFHWGKRVSDGYERQFLESQVRKMEVLIELQAKFKSEGFLLHEWQKKNFYELLEELKEDFYAPGRTFRV